MSDAWVRRQDVLIQGFVDGWSWEQVVASWLSRISELSVSLDRLWKQDYEACKAIEQGRERELRNLHPRIDEWPNISREELERLVWSKPTRLVAADFGVSDTAISKKCRLEGIRKPPRGFWARVDSGKLPHPQGKPPK